MITKRSKRTRVGLDIGYAGTRSIQLLRNGERYVVCRAARSTAIWTDQEGDHDAWLQRQLAICVQQADIRGSAVVTAMGTPDIEFHSLELPSAKSNDVAQVVQWEVRRLRTEESGDIETRHWRLPETSVPAPNAIGVAASRNQVEQRLAVCRDAGLRCEQIDTSATALCRFGSLLRPWEEETIWGLLDLSYREARLILCLGDTPILARTVGEGGSTWTQRIADSLHTSTKTADLQKREYGIGRTARGVRADAKAAPDAELGSILLGILRVDINDLTAEIKRSYEYILGCYPGRDAGDLILVGGGGGTRNLAEYLMDRLGIPVRRPAYYQTENNCRLEYASGNRNPMEDFALAIGLAVGS